MMPMRSLTFSPPPSLPHPDAPPSALLEQWIPELVDQHQVMTRAVAAALEAKDRFDACFPAAGGFAGGGTDWQSAVGADAAAVRRKHKPEALAALVAETPQRYGTWHARSLVAGELVGDWDLHACGRVTAESRARLVEEEQRLRAGIGEAAEAAVRVAGGVVRGGDVLRAAWKALSELDELAEAWRPVYALAAWTMGNRWQAPTDADWPQDPQVDGVATVLGKALALRDADLRRQLEVLAPAGRR